MATKVLGVLNVTPDSFSDANRFAEHEAAVKRGIELASLGASIVDVGGESTRPGATMIGAAEEQRRVLPVVRDLAREGICLSVDTLRASTAEAAVLAGARYVNDVSGGEYDPAMVDTIARLSANIDGVHYIIGHWRGIPDPEHDRSNYDDVVAEVAATLNANAQRALEAGVARENIVLDPGLGFDKTAEQCWEILRRLDEITALGYPVLIGASRKRMLAEIAGADKPATERDLATSVVSALSARAGAWGVRVHDVAATVQALAVTEAWGSAGTSPTHDVPRADPTPVTRSALSTIRLTGLEAFAHHGVFDFERANGQKFVIDAEVEVDLADTADDLSRTVHYGELAEAIVASVERDPVDLIETVAERLAGVALSFAGVRRTTVTVHKPEAPITVPFHDVSITVTRERAR
ncbi:dihydropteroate synthase [Leucobacter chinensis]|uniref:dihydropteroate synthase n=1 Tax=Leucobacter chinensis TaxID=2851010 RepID=UPI001C22EA3C|nr:dihydropteroate synthase [Leucobacter chinensis]